MLEETHEALAVGPSPEEQRRMRAAGLTAARDEAVEAGGRLVAARERVLALDALRASADDGALRANRRQARDAIAAFRREHGRTLEAAIVGVERIVARAGRISVDATLREIVPELCGPGPLPGELEARLLRAASMEAAGALLRSRLVDLAEADALELSPLPAADVEARVVRAEAVLRESEAAQSARLAEVPEPAPRDGEPWHAFHRGHGLSEVQLEEIAAALDAEEELERERLRAHDAAIVEAAAAADRVAAVLAAEES